MKKVLSIALVVLLAAMTSHAQESVLLKKYRQMALEHNPDVRASQKLIELNREIQKGAQSDLKPKLTANASYSYTANPMELAVNLPSAASPLSFKGNSMAYGTSVSLVQPVYSGGRNRQLLSMAQLDGSIASSRSKATMGNVSYEADFHYWKAVGQKEVLSITNRYYQSVSKLVDVVRNRVSVEFSNKNDLLMAEVKLNESRYQQLQAQNALEMELVSLNSLIGAELNTLTPVDSLVPTILSVASLSSEMEAATVTRGEVLAAQENVKLQQAAGEVAIARFKPQLFMGADASYLSPGYNFKSDLDPNLVLYAKLSIPIFEWGKHKSEKKAAAYRVDIAREGYDKAFEAVQLEVQRAYIGYNQAVEQVALAQSSLSKASENEQMAVERYTEGNLSIAEVLDAQIFHQTAQLNFVRSKINAQIYHSELIRAAGLY